MSGSASTFTPHAPAPSSTEGASLAQEIKGWARELGFSAAAIAGAHDLEEEGRLLDWIRAGHHGDMAYFPRHGATRARPGELVPGTVSIITVRLDYVPAEAKDSEAVLADPSAAFISRYALGRDYHKVIRNRLQQLAERIAAARGPFAHRAFSDSAPVMEVALARRAGLGWRGKHTLLLSREAGSFYFLGELFTDLALPADTPVDSHCGTCSRCIDLCPTQAITGPYQLDARRCISYLTIEHAGEIPEPLRPLMGNRIYGCDDCQLVCPWNKYAQPTRIEDFSPRHELDNSTLLRLFAWNEQEFLLRMEGSAIRRIGHERWLRNIAVALGNALAKPGLDGPTRTAMRTALKEKREHASALVQSHIDWALAQDNAT